MSSEEAFDLVKNNKMNWDYFSKQDKPIQKYILRKCSITDSIYSFTMWNLSISIKEILVFNLQIKKY